jgi:hypothetical protein
MRFPSELHWIFLGGGIVAVYLVPAFANTVDITDLAGYENERNLSHAFSYPILSQHNPFYIRQPDHFIFPASYLIASDVSTPFTGAETPTYSHCECYLRP